MKENRLCSLGLREMSSFELLLLSLPSTKSLSFIPSLINFVTESRAKSMSERIRMREKRIKWENQWKGKQIIWFRRPCQGNKCLPSIWDEGYISGSTRDNSRFVISSVLENQSWILISGSDALETKRGGRRERHSRDQSKDSILISSLFPLGLLFLLSISSSLSQLLFEDFDMKDDLLLQPLDRWINSCDDVSFEGEMCFHVLF
jgi:hypothetical protein